jgi:hypothetical protein
MFFARLLISSDLSKNPQALTIFTGFSIFFFWTGISFKISNRIFRVSEKFLSEQNAHAYHIHKYMQKMYECHVGNLKKYDDLEYLFDAGMSKGFFWEAAYIMFFNGLCYGDTGDRQKCKQITDKLLVVADQFENHQMRSMYFRFVAYTSVRFREFDNDQLERIKEGIEYMRKTEHYAPLAVLCSRLSIIYTIQGNLFDARKYLDEAGAHLKEFKTGKPFYSPYLLAKVSYELEQLRSNKTLNRIHKKELRNSVKELIRTSRKFRIVHPEALLLKAKVENGLLKKNACFKTLKKAQEFAAKIGARVELARIYFEIGKFLSDPNNKYKKLNGQTAEYYIEKAKVMFEEIDLQWDWLEYRKYQAS